MECMRFVDANVFICILAKSPKEDYFISESVYECNWWFESGNF